MMKISAASDGTRTPFPRSPLVPSPSIVEMEGLRGSSITRRSSYYLDTESSDTEAKRLSATSARLEFDIVEFWVEEDCGDDLENIPGQTVSCATESIHQSAKSTKQLTCAYTYFDNSECQNRFPSSWTGHFPRSCISRNLSSKLCNLASNAPEKLHWQIFDGNKIDTVFGITRDISQELDSLSFSHSWKASGAMQKRGQHTIDETAEMETELGNAMTSSMKKKPTPASPSSKTKRSIASIAEGSGSERSSASTSTNPASGVAARVVTDSEKLVPSTFSKSSFDGANANEDRGEDGTQIRSGLQTAFAYQLTSAEANKERRRLGSKVSSSGSSSSPSKHSKTSRQTPPPPPPFLATSMEPFPNSASIKSNILGDIYGDDDEEQFDDNCVFYIVCYAFHAVEKTNSKIKFLCALADSIFSDTVLPHGGISGAPSSMGGSEELDAYGVKGITLRGSGSVSELDLKRFLPKRLSSVHRESSKKMRSIGRSSCESHDSLQSLTAGLVVKLGSGDSADNSPLSGSASARTPRGSSPAVAGVGVGVRANLSSRSAKTTEKRESSEMEEQEEEELRRREGMVKRTDSTSSHNGTTDVELADPGEDEHPFCFSLDLIPVKSEIPTNLTMHDFSNIEYLTDGSNANVYLAVLKSINERVIIKVIKEAVQGNAVAQKEFDDEFHLLSRINHRNILKIYGAGLFPRKFIVLELLEGGTLSTILQRFSGRGGKAHQHHAHAANVLRRPPFTYRALLVYARDMAEALHYLHHRCHGGATILHRDLKPDNIGFTADGTLKLFDFGLSICVRRRHYSGLSYEMSGNTGSLRYMAPEVALDQPYTEKVDVYSFGIVLWQMARNHVPFHGFSKVTFMERVVHQNLRPELHENWPEDFSRLLASCWDVNVNKRPSFSVVVAELNHIMLDSSDDQEM